MVLPQCIGARAMTVLAAPEHSVHDLEFLRQRYFTKESVQIAFWNDCCSSPLVSTLGLDSANLYESVCVGQIKI